MKKRKTDKPKEIDWNEALIYALRRKIKRLEKDKARLDFAPRRLRTIRDIDGMFVVGIAFHPIETSGIRSFRQAIDAAMRAEKEIPHDDAK